MPPPLPGKHLCIFTHIFTASSLSPSLPLQSLLGRHVVTWLACCVNGKSVVGSTAHGDEDAARLTAAVARIVVVTSLHVLSCARVLVSGRLGSPQLQLLPFNEHPEGMIHKGNYFASLCRVGPQASVVDLRSRVSWKE